MRFLVLLMCWLLVLPTVGRAWDAVCSGVRQNCANTTGMSNYLQNRDLEQIPGPACTALPNDHLIVAEQRQLIQGVAQSHPNGRCHLKVVGGLAVEMSAVEKDAVNAAIQVITDEQQTYADAVANNDLCNATLEEIRTRKGQLDAALQGDIDGITNIATAKTELADMMGRLTASLLKLMECIRGRAGPPQ